MLSESPCPVTRGTGGLPPGETAKGAYYSNGALWVELWPDGVVLARSQDVRSDGSIDVKFPFWRGVVGRLRITGRRLDAVSPAPTADIPEGYGDTGFQATGVLFPSPGCWELTASVGGSSLTFVTEVKAP